MSTIEFYLGSYPGCSLTMYPDELRAISITVSFITFSPPLNGWPSLTCSCIPSITRLVQRGGEKKREGGRKRERERERGREREGEGGRGERGGR